MESEKDVDVACIRSLTYDTPTYVIFKNRSSRTVSVYWFDYMGKLKRYDILQPGEVLEMNTFVTHPWCAKDTHTNDELMIDHNDVYYPTPPQENGEDPIIYIDLPVYSLKVRCEQVIKAHMASKNLSDVEIPRELKQSLTTNKNVDYSVYSGN